MTTRSPTVAGSFYPADPAALRSQCEELLTAEAAEGAVGSVKAVVAPHAGYMYSGPLAARSLSALSDGRPVDRVVVLGPAHFVGLDGLALPDADALATPLGELKMDTEACAELANLPQVDVSVQAHLREHSIEVELPFLQLLFPEVRLVPLLVGSSPPEEVAEVLELLWACPATRFVVSSDLSHYLPYEEARQVDQRTVESILELDSSISTSQACGARPLNGLLLAARRHDLEPHTLGAANSGDMAGDRQQVVGYGAFAFTEN